MATPTQIVEYGCETKDGGSGFGIGKIICENHNDAQAVFEAIKEHPDRFDFAPHDDGRRYVQYQCTTADGLGGTAYLD